MPDLAAAFDRDLDKLLARTAAVGFLGKLVRQVRCLLSIAGRGSCAEIGLRPSKRDERLSSNWRPP